MNEIKESEAPNALSCLTAKLEEVAPLAKDVAALRDETVEKEAAALDALLQKMAPLMSTFAGQIEVSYFCSGNPYSPEHRRFADKMGLVVVDQFGRECEDKDTRGEYIGYQVVLWSDCRFTIRRRSGGWSRWQGEPSEWSITEEQDLTVRDVVECYGLRPIALSLTEHVDRAAEELKEKMAEYQERLDMIEKVREALA